MSQTFAISIPLAVACAAVLAIGVLAWLVSVIRRNAGVADVAWGGFFLTANLVYACVLPQSGPRSAWLTLLVAAWALRLSGYIGWRNHGQPEDRRYQQIRARNQPHFELKSLYLVFGLQAALACVIAAPLFAALSSPRPHGWLDAAGAALWAFGWLYETVADWQLAAFKAGKRADAHGDVMDRGLWRYSRHPNYFGECCVWWGFYLIALSAGGWWSVFSPLLMTVLLLKVSGVALLEKEIGERRPAYHDYIRRTNAFLPGWPRDTAR